MQIEYKKTRNDRTKSSSQTKSNEISESIYYTFHATTELIITVATIRGFKNLSTFSPSTYINILKNKTQQT